MDLFGEAVHHHTDCIVSLRLRQLSNQVDTDDLPGFRGNIMGVERVVRALPDGFDPLALSTPFDVFPDVPVDPWPPVVASDQLMGLVPSRVPCQGGVMVESNDFLPERGILGHIDAVLPCDHPILVGPPLGPLVQGLLHRSIQVVPPVANPFDQVVSRTLFLFLFSLTNTLLWPYSRSSHALLCYHLILYFYLQSFVLH